MIKGHFDNKIGDFTIYNITEEPYEIFNITFDAYHYHIVNFSYNRGSIGCGLSQGKYDIELKTSQEWYDKADMDVFCKELQEQLELRIPNKFLEHYGWK
ncbi:hypothetical protein [Amphibacillus jilinensis]|uniref:hypothetical protein n=1 Tax=Amphibacillus jilinensis TaxID=1216008 RepID=UPI0003195845|nr:hypothetical protein [Amphibacillus jilinensis]